MRDKVIDLILTFGLDIDLDNWENKGWIRAQDFVYVDIEPLILYKNDVETIGLQYVKDELCSYLLKLGEHQFKKKLNDLIKL